MVEDLLLEMYRNVEIFAQFLDRKIAPKPRMEHKDTEKNHEKICIFEKFSRITI